MPDLKVKGLRFNSYSFELYEFEFTKVAWKSMKSVMIASKSKSKEKNSFMILESQTNDVN